jgi:hypothetical protein
LSKLRPTTITACSYAVTVFDRDAPVARTIPIAAPSLEVRKAKRPVRDLTLPPKLAKRTDSVALLLDDRRCR